MPFVTRSLKLKFSAVVLAIVFCASASSGAQERARLDSAVSRAFGGQQGAAAVLRVSDGQLLAAHNRAVLARRIATPGSAVKPFVLSLLLERGLVRADETIVCRRNLTIAGKRLNCSHPPEFTTFSAKDALAFSCNSYFVTAAARLNSGELERRFAELGFTRVSGLLPGEGEGRISSARTLEERQLLAIGAAGIQVTPIELAAAYLQIARVNPSTATAAHKEVLAGLHDAVDYGLAQNAATERLAVSGKTGTASDPGSAITHAWFAGFAPTAKPEIVVVVFVEQGRGSLEAARIAHRIFAAWAEQRR